MRNKSIVYSSQVTLQRNYSTFTLWRKEKDRKMRQHIYDTWTLIMDSDRSPLKNIPDNNARHLSLQILAWMWCIVFSIFLGSYLVFGLTAIAHVLLLAAIAVTVGTFDTANRNPQMLSDVAKRLDGYNGRRNNGEHD